MSLPITPRSIPAVTSHLKRAKSAGRGSPGPDGTRGGEHPSVVTLSISWIPLCPVGTGPGRSRWRQGAQAARRWRRRVWFSVMTRLSPLMIRTLRLPGAARHRPGFAPGPRWAAASPGRTEGSGHPRRTPCRAFGAAGFFLALFGAAALIHRSAGERHSCCSRRIPFFETSHSGSIRRAPGSQLSVSLGWCPAHISR